MSRIPRRIEKKHDCLALPTFSLRYVAGVSEDLYYVRNGKLNDYALAFNMPLKSNITEIFFDWNATSSQPAVSNELQSNTIALCC